MPSPVASPHASDPAAGGAAAVPQAGHAVRDRRGGRRGRGGGGGRPPRAELATRIPADAAVEAAPPAVFAAPPPLTLELAGVPDGVAPRLRRDGEENPVVRLYVAPEAILFVAIRPPPPGSSSPTPILFALPLPDRTLHDRLEALLPPAADGGT